METILIEFVDTLDSLLKKLQQDVAEGSGFSKLTINQFHYIDAIASLGQPTITEIAERLKITRASVTTGINKLVAMGYVTKTQSTQDRRVIFVGLTEAGEHLVEAKYKALNEYGAFIRAALNEDEARQLEGILTKLVQLFKQSR